MSQNLPERSTQRASDSDREIVVERLRTAAEEGRLDLAEFEERMAAAYTSKTYGELAPLTADLPEVGGSSAMAPQAEMTLRAVGSSLTRKGQWRVPERIVLDAKMGSSKLDFTKATVQTREVELAITATAGSVHIVLPRDADVDANELTTNFGSTKLPSHPPDAPRFRLRLTGQAHMGSVKVRYPNFWDRLLERLRRF